MAVECEMQSRMLMKLAERTRATEAVDRRKVLQHIKNGDNDSAKVFAENAIRNKKEALSVYRFGVKMNVLASKIKGAVRAQ